MLVIPGLEPSALPAGAPRSPASLRTYLRYGSLRCCCAFPLLFLSLVVCRAQGGITRPVLSATPTPTQTPPANTSVVASSQQAASLPEISSSYLIGPEDNIQVTVWKEPNLTGSLAVRPDGMISIPLLGDVAAAGLTPMSLSDEITLRLKKYITDPNVTVTVLATTSKRVFLVGEVQHVGPIPLSAGLTVLQAIATAGGVTPFANTKHLYLLRGSGSKQQKIPFSYKKAVKDGNLQGLELQPGDTIVVP